MNLLTLEILEGLFISYVGKFPAELNMLNLLISTSYNDLYAEWLQAWDSQPNST